MLFRVALTSALCLAAGVAPAAEFAPYAEFQRVMGEVGQGASTPLGEFCRSFERPDWHSVDGIKMRPFLSRRVFHQLRAATHLEVGDEDLEWGGFNIFHALRLLENADAPELVLKIFGIAADTDFLSAVSRSEDRRQVELNVHEEILAHRHLVADTIHLPVHVKAGISIEGGGYAGIGFPVWDGNNLHEEYLAYRDKVRGNAIPNRAFASTEEYLRVALDTAAAVAYFNERLAFAHLDVKPSNFQLGTDGSVALTDYETAVKRAELPRVVAEGVVTPTYASVRRVLQKSIGVREDTVGLALTLADLWTGQDGLSERTLKPKRHEMMWGRAASFWYRRVKPMQQDNPIGDVILAALHPLPWQRPASAAAMFTQIAERTKAHFRARH